MKKTLGYLIVSILLFFLVMSNAYMYRIDNKNSFIDTLDNKDIELNDEKLITFTAKKNNLNIIKLNLEYQNNYNDKQELLIKIFESDRVIKEEKISLIKLKTYKNIQINVGKIKNSSNKDYKIQIKPLNNVDCTISNINTLYYQNYHNIIYTLVISSLIIITFVLLKKLFNDKNIKVEKWYLILSIIIYGAYIVVFPLFASHDEFYHWGRAYEISEGHLLSEVHDKYATTKLPTAVLSIYNTDYQNIRYATTINSKDEKIVKGNDNMFDMKTVAVYSPVQYIPQSLGIMIARIFTDRTLIMAYAARIMNAILSIILMYLAIKIIPFGKRVLFTIGFIPIAIEGFTSLSADAITISTSILFLSYILNLKFNKKIKILEKKHYIILLIMSIVIALCKIVYIPLIFLILLLPKEKFKNNNHRKKFLISILVISVVLNLLWLSIASMYLTFYETTGSQVTSVIKHPINFIQIFLYTILSQNQLYIYTMFGYNLGWGEAIHPYSIIPLVLMILLVINTLADKEMNKKINVKETLIITGIVVLILCLIYASLYVQFTPPGFRYILGVQGRYFLPFLPLLMIITSKINMEYKGNLNLDMISIITCLLVNISVILTLFERFI